MYKVMKIESRCAKCDTDIPYDQEYCDNCKMSNSDIVFGFSDVAEVLNQKEEMEMMK